VGAIFNRDRYRENREYNSLPQEWWATLNATLANVKRETYPRRVMNIVKHRAWSAGVTVLLLSVFTSATIAADAPARPTVGEIVQSVLDQRFATDVRLKAKLSRPEGLDRNTELGAVEVLMRRTDKDTRTVVRALEPAKYAGTTLLVIQPHAADAAPRFFLAGKDGKTEELARERLKETIIGSDFSYEDLNLAFSLYWTRRELIGEEITRGQTCYRVEFKASKDAASQYARVVTWIEKNRRAVVKTEAFDEDGRRVRSFSVAALRKVKTAKGNEIWAPRALEILWFPPQQALPSAQKTRLEVIEAQYELELPDRVFAEETFGQGVGQSR